MEGLRLGSVHISLIGLTLMPYLDVIWGPYVFRDNDHGRKVLDGEMGQECISSDQKYLDLLKSKGMIVVQADVNAYREATKDVWKQFMPKAWGEGVYEKVQAVK
jgi:TRAP-type C4-dicarboxylate transport system substrate-binding protein